MPQSTREEEAAHAALAARLAWGTAPVPLFLSAIVLHRALLPGAEVPAGVGAVVRVDFFQLCLYLALHAVMACTRRACTPRLAARVALACALALLVLPSTIAARAQPRPRPSPHAPHAR